MIKIPGCFILREIYLYRSKEDPSTFFYLPGKPLPETGPGGKPTLLLIASNRGAILQLGTRWSIESSLLSALKNDLSGKFPELQRELIKLSPAQISVSRATLYLGDGSGKFNELQFVKSSGFPPFTALFNITLSSEDKAKVISSINGRQNILKVSYKASLSVELETRVSIYGDVRREISVIDKNASLDDARSLVESAILNGSLNVESFADEGVSQGLKDSTSRQAKEKAASAIMAMVSGSSGYSGNAKLESTVSRTETMDVPFESSTDISSWFPGRTGTDHIIVSGITITEPDKSSVTQPVGQSTRKTKFVKLGFNAGKMPVAFIDLKLGNISEKLIGPRFTEVSLLAEADSELVVRTNYTSGGPVFETRLPLTDSEGWTLKPEDLGLFKIVLDGSGLKAAGSTDARVRVVYRPSRSGKGTYNGRTIDFKQDNWIASWFIITRSAGLEGFLEVVWRETAADGSVVFHQSIKTDKNEIKL